MYNQWSYVYQENSLNNNDREKMQWNGIYICLMVTEISADATAAMFMYK